MQITSNSFLESAWESYAPQSPTGYAVAGTALGGLLLGGALLYGKSSEVSNRANPIPAPPERQNDLDRLQKRAWTDLSNFKGGLIPTAQKLLPMLFYARNPNPEAIEAVLDKAIQERTQNAPKPKKKCCSWSRPKYRSISGASPNQLVWFSHGGGHRFIHQFFQGANKGYANETGGQGIFVTPHRIAKTAAEASSNRDTLYALRAPLKWIDQPVILKGQIPARYLKVVNHNGGYEAVIFPKDRHHVVNVSLESIDLRDRPFAARKELIKLNIPILPRSLEKEYPPHVSEHIRTVWSQFTGQNSRR